MATHTSHGRHDHIGLSGVLQKSMIRSIAIALLITIPCLLFAQKDVTTFGVQLKPMIPSKFFNSGVTTETKDYLSVDFTPKVGWNFGMLMRVGFTDMFSLETGINLVRRNYNVTVTDLDYGAQLSLDYTFVGYEVPVQGLIYVKLGDQFWMNASGGLSFDTYPSNAFSAVNTQVDTLALELEQRTFRRQWVQMSVLANYGFEYRTKEKGYWYLGASYHRPFSDMATTEAKYVRNTVPLTVASNLSGSYLTVDLRYFFHEDPERKRRARPKPGK